MHIRLPGLFAMLAATSAIIGACAVPSAAAVVAGVTRDTGITGFAAVRSDPPPEEPCPNGEPKPCGAATKERDGVETGRADAKKDIASAKDDIASAKKKAEQCPPGSKQCMEELIGGGADQRQGMDEARQGLTGMRPAPSGNAGPVLAGTCREFAADLPGVLTDSTDLTRLCEAMNS